MRRILLQMGSIDGEEVSVMFVEIEIMRVTKIGDHNNGTFVYRPSLMM